MKRTMMSLGLLLIAPSDYNPKVYIPGMTEGWTVPRSVKDYDYSKFNIGSGELLSGRRRPGSSAPIERRGTKSDFTPMYNPASRYCTEQGYRLEFREGELGQIGFCINEPLECPEWAFYYGSCSLDLGFINRIK